MPEYPMLSTLVSPMVIVLEDGVTVRVGVRETVAVRLVHAEDVGLIEKEDRNSVV